MVNFVLSMEEFGSSITMVHDNKLDLIHDFFFEFVYFIFAPKSFVLVLPCSVETEKQKQTSFTHSSLLW
jgi:hypothetical protein